MFMMVKKFEDSDKYYQKALNIDGSNVYVLNNWALFIPSKRTIKLRCRKDPMKLAQTMQTLDTYAWVLYKQGKYSEALTWLEKKQNSSEEWNCAGALWRYFI
jgi:Tfp pilus assembly protein PilF